MSVLVFVTQAIGFDPFDPACLCARISIASARDQFLKNPGYSL